MTHLVSAKQETGRRRATAVETRFGWMAMAATTRGLCWLELAGSEQQARAGLRAGLAGCTLEEDRALAVYAEWAMAEVEGGPEPQTHPLDLQGTEFQSRVWTALRRIPRGEWRSYGQLAHELGMPGGTRAVAGACARNRVAVLVPCHRVLGARGSLTGYRWGLERKQNLLQAERDSLL